jgi:hypothetical protein
VQVLDIIEREFSMAARFCARLIGPIRKVRDAVPGTEASVDVATAGTFVVMEA